MKTKITPSSGCVFTDLGIEKPAMTDTSLKACPFCNGTDISSFGDDKVVGYYCRKCEAHGPNQYGQHEWNTRAALSAQSETDECICIACAKPLNAGDMVLLEMGEGGLIHAECCGPERESYCDADGEPLADDAPIPTPFPYNDVCKDTTHLHPVETVQADAQPVAWRYKEDSGVWHYVEGYEPVRRDNVEPLYSKATVAALVAERDVNWQEYLDERSARMALNNREFANMTRAEASEADLKHLRSMAGQSRGELEASLAKCKREKEGLREERYKLAYAICGGEDAPGLLDSLSVEQIIKIHTDNIAFQQSALNSEGA